VYGSSVLAIAATYGTGADAGLPDVLFSSWEPFPSVEMIRGIRLATTSKAFASPPTSLKITSQLRNAIYANNIMLHTMNVLKIVIICVFRFLFIFYSTRPIISHKRRENYLFELAHCYAGFACPRAWFGNQHTPESC
jgi:hypothetical protein